MDQWKDDIEKYKAGKLTPAERHALEKKALSDPFLADALEGAEEISGEVFLNDIEELNQKILSEKKNRWLWPLRIAASIVGIALISSIIIYNTGTPEENLASNQKLKDSSSQATADTIQLASEENAIDSIEEPKSDENLVAVLKETKPKSEKPATSTSQAASGGTSNTIKPTSENLLAQQGDRVKDSNSSTAGDLASTSELAEVKLDQEDAIVAAPTSQSAPSAEKKSLKEETVSRSRASASGDLQVRGVVRDQKGQPIPGVNIVVKGSTIGTISDADGKYSINLSNPNQTLIYTFIGYTPQELPIQKSTDGTLDVKLEEDITQLSEVVVTGYGIKQNNGEPVVRLAEPMGGRKAYDQYLEDKKVYPPQALENKVEGRVIIEFTVGVSGALSDFHVVRKIGYGCEEEVVRLVKEGPAWNPSYIDNEAVESLVRIKTRFSLPDK